MNAKNHIVKYFVDATGRYLGAFENHERDSLHHVTTSKSVQVERPTGLLDEAGQSITRPVEESRDHVERVQLTIKFDPTYPKDAIEVPTPPAHANQLWVNGEWKELSKENQK